MFNFHLQISMWALVGQKSWRWKHGKTVGSRNA